MRLIHRRAELDIYSYSIYSYVITSEMPEAAMRFTLRSILVRRKKKSGDDKSAAERRVKLLTALVILATAAVRLAEVVWMMWGRAP